MLIQDAVYADKYDCLHIPGQTRGSAPTTATVVISQKRRGQPPWRPVLHREVMVTSTTLLLCQQFKQQLQHSGFIYAEGDGGGGAFNRALNRFLTDALTLLCASENVMVLIGDGFA